MKRRALSTKARLEIFQTTGGRCHLCGGRIAAGEAWDVEHVIPLAMGGDDGGENTRPAHRKCHRSKTSADVGDLARAKRREARHRGAFRSRRPMMGWKRFDGSPVRRL